MHRKISSYLLASLIICGFALNNTVLAEDENSRTSLAVANILFDYDAEEFSSYSIRDDGFLDITFASNTPDALYSEILNKLQNSPNVAGVLSGKGGPVCSSF